MFIASISILNGISFDYRIRSDHNEDNSVEILRKWISVVQHQYHSIHTEFLSSPPYRLSEEKGPAHWPPERFTHIIQLREEALSAGRNLWADYVWVRKNIPLKL